MGKPRYGGGQDWRAKHISKFPEEISEREHKRPPLPSPRRDLFRRRVGAKIQLRFFYARQFGDRGARVSVAADRGNREVPELSGNGAGARGFQGGDGYRGGAACESDGQGKGIAAGLHRPREDFHFAEYGGMLHGR